MNDATKAMIYTVGDDLERYRADDKLEYWVRKDMGWTPDDLARKQVVSFEYSAVRTYLKAVDWDAVRFAYARLQVDSNCWDCGEPDLENMDGQCSTCYALVCDYCQPEHACNYARNNSRIAPASLYGCECAVNESHADRCAGPDCNCH
jgi:hypothetical protein